jgi:hypothetical protein
MGARDGRERFAGESNVPQTAPPKGVEIPAKWSEEQIRERLAAVERARKAADSSDS